MQWHVLVCLFLLFTIQHNWDMLINIENTELFIIECGRTKTTCLDKKPYIASHGINYTAQCTCYVTHTLLYSKEWKWWQHACVWNSLFFVFQTHATAGVAFIKHEFNLCMVHSAYMLDIQSILCNVQYKGRKVIYKLNTTQLSIGHKHSYNYTMKTMLNYH